MTGTYLPGVGGEVDKSGGHPPTPHRGSLFSEVGWAESGLRVGGTSGTGGRGRGSRPAAGLDVLTALHLWFVLGGLHLDVDHVVARRHVTLVALRHLLLRDDAVDF